MSWKKSLFIMAMSSVFLLSACGGTTEEQIYNHLEEAVDLEAGFDEQQNEITELEKQEQKIYSEIIELGSDELDEIKKSAQQATEIIEERADKLEAEKESISESKAEFEKTDKLIDKLDDEQAQEKGREMYDVMMERYDTYDTLHEAYTGSLDLEKELYAMLQKEDVEQSDLTDHIEKINNSYGKVLEANEEFNQDTAAFNEIKKEFYETADIDVEYEDTSGKDENDQDQDNENKKE